MRPTAVLLLLVLHAVAGLNQTQVKTSLLDFTRILPSLSRPANQSSIFYAVMFDAGSTGTRIHVYTFIQSDPKQLPVLDNEMFHSVKPGLSAYANSPEMAGQTVNMLLKVAKKTVPRLDWKRTPLVFRATAGFRLLPAEKTQALLDQVQHVFDESPFMVPGDSVSVMDGTNEGVLAWISLNFLTGHLNAAGRQTVGILDLGGGSTQITFLPKQRKTIKSVPVADYVAKFNLFNSTFELYSHSYLGNGLMAARLATLGAPVSSTDDAKNTASHITLGSDQRVFNSSCFPNKFRDEWSFGGVTYQVSGNPDGDVGYKHCYQEVLKVVKGVIHQPYRLQDATVFYAFSYYFDRAVDAGLIDGVQAKTVRVRDFKQRAKEVCKTMTKHPTASPYLCMDMTYITCLLKDGFGFKEITELQLAKTVKNVEASWALGATLGHFHNLKIY